MSERPPFVRGGSSGLVVEALLGDVERRKAVLARTRRRWPFYLEYAKRYLPELFPDLVGCKEAYVPYRSEADRYKVVARSCHILPWCVPCTSVDSLRRMSGVFDRMQMMTPRREAYRFYHVVLTAPIPGWGEEASSHVSEFQAVGWRVLRELYGPKAGALVAYQDFGESPFRKRHPHLDVVLHGSTWDGVELSPLREYDAKADGGRNAYQAATRFAQSLRLGAEGTNFRVFGPRVGAEALRGVAAYMSRNMVDLRNYQFADEGRNVMYVSPKGPTRDVIPASGFRGWVHEYGARLGQWGLGEPRELIKGFGFLAKGGIRARSKAVGGGLRPHEGACTCSRCGEWTRIGWAEVESALRVSEAPLVGA